MLTSTLPDVEQAEPVGRPIGSRPPGGSAAVSRRDCGEPVHVGLASSTSWRVAAACSARSRRAALVIPSPMNKFTDILGTHLLPRSLMTAVFGRMLSRARVPRPPADADRRVRVAQR